MNVNENVGNEGVVPANQEGGEEDFKFEISDLKGEPIANEKGNPAVDGAGSDAVAVGDAAVTVVSCVTGEGVESGTKTRTKNFGARRRIDSARESVGDPVAGVLNGRKRWGKIARMPFEVREWLNEQIRDGVIYVEISSALKDKGFEGVTKFDLSTWRRGGHEEWLRDQERLAAIRNDVGRVVKAIGELSENEAEGVERFNEMLIGMQIVHALQDLHRGALKGLVETKPELLFRVAKAASDQARDRARRKRANLLVQKYDDVMAEKKREFERENLPKIQRGLSPETLIKLEAAMARL